VLPLGIGTEPPARFAKLPSSYGSKGASGWRSRLIPTRYGSSSVSRAAVSFHRLDYARGLVKDKPETSATELRSASGGRRIACLLYLAGKSIDRAAKQVVRSLLAAGSRGSRIRLSSRVAANVSSTRAVSESFFDFSVIMGSPGCGPDYL
jgi:hypothetical protein